MRWYLSQDGRSEGPLDEPEVLSRIASGRLRRDAWAAPEGAPEWHPLAAHPPFARGLAEAAPRGRGAEATIVGGRAPRLAPPSSPGMELSLSGASAPGVMAIPIAGQRPRRRRALLGLGLLVVLAAGGGLFLLYDTRDRAPLALAIESAVVEDVDREVLGSAGLADERVRVRVRTEPGARVRVSSSPEVIADADGVATVLHAFARTRQPSVEIDVRAVIEEGGRAREARERRSVARLARISLRGAVAECSTRSCALGVEPDGALTVSGVDPATRVTLGASAATGAAPDPSEDVLAVLSPDALFGDEGYTVALPLRFELPDGARFEGVYPVGAWSLRRILFERFVAVEDGAVRVPAEGRGSATLWIGGVGAGRSAADMRLIGEAATVGDIGRVAIVSARPRRRACGRYEAQGARAVYVEQRDASIVVHDRRRGRAWRRRIVSAPRVACPRTITIEPGSDDIEGGRSEADPEAIEAWLRRL